MDGNKIKSITGWQTTTYTYHTINAKIFADCSGDGILAPLTGAEYRVGREARSEFGESIAPEVADKKTMGMTCLFQARDTGEPQAFEPPSWAYDYPTEDSLPNRWHGWLEMGYWWIELGGEQDTIYDTEEIRDELLKTVYGVWDHIKNHGDHGAQNWTLEWVQFIPGKRESRRYVGAHVLTQNDIEAEGRFDDIVAYGGWPMDDHPPAGFKHKGHPTTFYPTPSPYGISYRCLYSKNIENLMFAGRNASCTHAAMSSTRVMGTGASMGQAVGTAAAMAIEKNVSLPEIGSKYISELQQSLLRQDAYLPWIPQKLSAITMNADLTATSGNPEPLRDGINRPVGDNIHAWEGNIGDCITYKLNKLQLVESVTLITDSALDKQIAMSLHQADSQLRSIPEEMAKDIRIEISSGGVWQPWKEIKGNYMRLVRCNLGAEVDGVRVIVDSTWGSKKVRLYAFYLD